MRKKRYFWKKRRVEEKLISKKKPLFPISDSLMQFLKKYDRWMESSICYEDLLRFSGSVVVYDKNDDDTLWVKVYYSDCDRQEIDQQLKAIYTQLHSDGGNSSLPDLNIDAIDYCTFGNSKPFRIKIRNILNDNFTYFYVKKTDASTCFLLTECGLTSRLQTEVPGKTFVGTCTMCKYMKSNSLDNIHASLQSPTDESIIEIPKETSDKALSCIQAMFDFVEKK